MTLNTAITLTYTPTAKHSSVQAGLLMVALGSLLAGMVLALGDWRFPWPIGSLTDLFVWLVYAVLAGILVSAVRVAWHLHRRTTSRLYIHADGLRYETPFSQFQVSWDEVERINVGSFGQVRLYPRSELRVPPVLDKRLVSRARTAIPLSDFGDIYGSGELAKALRTWVPHLIPPKA